MRVRFLDGLPSAVLASIVIFSSLFLPLQSVSAVAEQPAPRFKEPWTCNLVYSVYTYSGHGAHAIDISAVNTQNAGAPVLASADGTAESMTGSGFGLYVEIDHGSGWKTRYAHMSSFDGLYDRNPNQDGIQIHQGDQIGTIGNTGASQGAHIHYEQWKGKERMPVTFNGQYPTVSWDGVGVAKRISTNCQSNNSAQNKVVDLEWFSTTATEVEASYDYIGKPSQLTMNGDLHTMAVTKDGRLIQTDVEAGTTSEIQGAGTFSWGVDAHNVDDNYLVFGVAPNGDLIQLSKKDGESEWYLQNLVEHTDFIGAPSAIFNGDSIRIYVVTTDGRLTEVSNTATENNPNEEWTATEVKLHNEPDFPDVTVKRFGPGVDAVRVEDTTHVMGVDVAGNLVQVSTDSTKPGNWSAVSELITNTNFIGAPSVVWGPIVKIYATTIDGRLIRSDKTSDGWVSEEMSPAKTFSGGVDARRTGPVTNVIGS